MKKKKHPHPLNNINTSGQSESCNRLLFINENYCRRRCPYVWKKAVSRPFLPSARTDKPRHWIYEYIINFFITPGTGSGWGTYAFWTPGRGRKRTKTLNTTRSLPAVGRHAIDGTPARRAHPVHLFGASRTLSLSFLPTSGHYRYYHFYHYHYYH